MSIIIKKKKKHFHEPYILIWNVLYLIVVVEHQDSTFLCTTPDSLVGFWIALDDATLENGCLWVIPGSHKAGLHKRLIHNSNEQSTDFQGTFPKYEQSSYVPVVVEKCKQ